MRLVFGIAGLLASSLFAPAFAQETPPLPRFEALEQQQLTLEQDRLDNFARQQQFARDLTLSPNSGVTAADRALRDLEFRRQMDLLVLEGQQQRDLVARERAIDQASLPNRRIAPFSPAVVQDPVGELLPPAPAGYYYARLDGRYVLVDAGSQLVVKVLEPQPTDPVDDLPARPLPPLQQPPGVRVWTTEPAALPPLGTSVVGIRADTPVSSPPFATGPSPPKQPPLPTRQIRPDSSLVVRDLAGQKLGAPPPGHYYARLDGRIYLVDARTYLVIALIRP
jgi:Ni/Co efflux regulator RcnB